MISWRTPSSCRLIDAVRERTEGKKSARALKRAIEANGCRVNGRIERFSSRPVQKGDQIEFLDKEESKGSSVKTILFEDEDLLVLDKPAGVLSTEALKRPGVIISHRLDKDTTGVLLFTKNSRAEQEVRALFEQRLMEKEYLALVDGRPKQQSGLIKSLLSKKSSFQGQTIWGSSGRGLYAETAWSVHTHFEDRSLLCCKPKTGRTHQIRVHLAEMGHPILIDRQYASQFRSQLFASRPLLHAWRLSFSWRGKKLAFEAPLPQDLHEAISHR